MAADAHALTYALETEGGLELEEDRRSAEKGALIRAQREALDWVDDEQVERFGTQIHEIELQRRAVRA